MDSVTDTSGTTTYVLGAGASLHAGYPLASSMQAQLIDWMKSRLSTLEYAKLASSLEQWFPAVADFEELLTRVQQLIETYENGTPEQRQQRVAVAHAEFVLRQAVRDWFAEIRLKPAYVYKQLAADVLMPGDTILTFNYDLSCERELLRAAKWQIGDGYGFTIRGLPEGSSVKVLKLHGSTNWLAPLGRFGSHPVVPPDDLSFFEYPMRDPAFEAGTAMPVVIMPARSKRFFFDTTFGPKFNDFWDRLWDKAASVLRRSGRIRICGYSLPSADQRARDLLLNAPQKSAEIVVVSGDQSERIVGEFRARGYKDATLRAERFFDAWVTAEAKRLPGMAAS